MGRLTPGKGIKSWQAHILIEWRIELGETVAGGEGQPVEREKR